MNIRLIGIARRHLAFAEGLSKAIEKPEPFIEAFRTGFATALLKAAEPPVAKRMHVSIDSLPSATQDDIVSNVHEGVKHLRDKSYDEVHSNLIGLAEPPHVPIGTADPNEMKSQFQKHRSVSEPQVNALRAKLANGGELDPIITAHGKFHDGGHRVEAYVREGRKSIPTVDIGHLLKMHWPSWMAGKPMPHITHPDEAIEKAFDVAITKGSEPAVAKRMHVNNLLISIENPKGSVRSKGDWQRKMHADYGRIVGAHGPKDKDQVDVFVGPDHEPKNAYIISQLDKDGSFDEFKCVVGVGSKDEAKALYLKHYPAGWKVGHIEEKPWDKFLVWLKDGQTSGEACPHCGAVLEKGDGKCNSCGKPWPIRPGDFGPGTSNRNHGNRNRMSAIPHTAQKQHVRAGASHAVTGLTRVMSNGTRLMPYNEAVEMQKSISVSLRGSSEARAAFRDGLSKAIDKRDKGTAAIDFDAPEHKPIQPEMFTGEVPKSPHFSPTQAQLTSAQKDRHPAIDSMMQNPTLRTPHEHAYATALHAWHYHGEPGMSPLYEGQDEGKAKQVKATMARMVKEHGAKKPVMKLEWERHGFASQAHADAYSASQVARS